MTWTKPWLLFEPILVFLESAHFSWISPISASLKRLALSLVIGPLGNDKGSCANSAPFPSVWSTCPAPWFASPPECWATVVVALEWYQLGRPWQLSRPPQFLLCLLHHFTFPSWCCHRRSSGGVYSNCWVMRKTSFLPHYEVWRTVSPILEMYPFSTSSSAPEREGKRVSCGCFSLSFLWIILNGLMLLQQT